MIQMSKLGKSGPIGTVYLNTVRKSVLIRDNHICVDCKAKAQVTHHLIPRWVDISKINDVDNIVSLCWDCHLKRHYVVD